MKKAIVRRNGKREYLVFDYETGEPILSAPIKYEGEMISALCRMGYSGEPGEVIVYDLENQIELVAPLHARQVAKEILDYEVAKQKELNKG